MLCVRTEDYEQLPQTDRDQLMVHVFYYLNGLDGTVGDLIALPRSQKAVMERGAFSALWQDSELPGSLSFGAQIPLRFRAGECSDCPLCAHARSPRDARRRPGQAAVLHRCRKLPNASLR